MPSPKHERRYHEVKLVDKSGGEKRPVDLAPPLDKYTEQILFPELDQHLVQIQPMAAMCNCNQLGTAPFQHFPKLRRSVLPAKNHDRRGRI